MNEEKKNYFGMKSYAAVSDTGTKTATGVPILKVLYEDGTVIETTEKFFNLVRSDVPLDASKFRELLMPKVIEQFFVVMTDYNVCVADMPVLYQRLEMAWNNTFNNAMNFALGVSHIDHIDMIKINSLNDKSEASKTAIPTNGEAKVA